MAAVAGLLPSSHLRRLRLIISPRTLLRWHADLWSASDGRTRAALSSGPGPRHQCALLLEMARDNPGCGTAHPQ